MEHAASVCPDGSNLHAVISPCSSADVAHDKSCSSTPTYSMSPRQSDNRRLQSTCPLDRAHQRVLALSLTRRRDRQSHGVRLVVILYTRALRHGHARPGRWGRLSNGHCRRSWMLGGRGIGPSRGRTKEGRGEILGYRFWKPALQSRRCLKE